MALLMSFAGPGLLIYALAWALRFIIFRKLSPAIGWLVAPILSFLMMAAGIHLLTTEAPFVLLYLFWLGVNVVGIASATSVAIVGVSMFNRAKSANV